ncbi:hypothetical protein C8T65DRAFT_573097 [Cerioporus squamosus]|nr:hypothetical protein C8T65DRAFT_573097 [Cerioporus squamosus]
MWLTYLQILALACDNATNNNTMIEQLTAASNLLAFDGHRARVRCFLHILNLVAKSLICQFDAGADKDKADEDADERLLTELAGGLNGPDADDVSVPLDDPGEGLDNDPDDEVDPLEDLSPEERTQFELDVRPVKLVIAKVRLLVL